MTLAISIETGIPIPPTRIDRRVATGKATRKQVLRGLDLLRKARAETSREGRV